ncbi:MULTISPECIES: MFS transporter [unclassified Leucobacter]|uniref:MFS transporter n=1 Tax=unclassified Leucobacter TaxID=2621730 RepID=UPI0030179995
MAERAASERSRVVRWVRTVPVIFLLLGMSFGTWLSRLPAVRDHLGATASEMSVYGLCLAVGSLSGLIISGRIVHRFGPRRTIFVGTVAMAITLPSAAAIILYGAIPPGLAVLFAYGFAFSICDVAMNVSGANAEAAFGRPRMPLMHAGYSLGAVAATGLGGLAEALRVPVPVHFAAVMLVSAVVLFALLRNLPRDEHAARSAAELASSGHDPATGPIPVIDSAAGEQPAFTTVTGSIPVQRPDRDSGPNSEASQALGSARPYSPWRDPRILCIGLLTLSFGLFEGTASDWLPLALVDGRGLSNQLGSVMLSVFFVAVMAVRIAGSWLIMRFGRVPVMRASAVIAATGVMMTILLPGTAGAVAGVLAWGVGTSLGWPIAISAAADRADTAARDVAAVSALGYGSMLVGPMAFGFLGEHIGLLTAFWALLPFAAYVLFAASAARSRR